MNINRFVRGKTVVNNIIFCAGGQPRFCTLPRFRFWGPYLSVFWIGAELIIHTKIDTAR